MVRYAEELWEDAREHPAATSWVRRALRHGELASGMNCLARLLWRRRKFDEAFELYRLGACLDDTKEEPARQYFSAARQLNRTESALPPRPLCVMAGRKTPKVIFSKQRQASFPEVGVVSQLVLPSNAGILAPHSPRGARC